MIPPHFLPHEILVVPYLGETAYGPAWGETSTMYAARVELGTHVVSGREGETDQTATGKIYVNPPADFNLQDRVDWQGTTYTVIDVNPAHGIRQLSHYVLDIK